MIDILMPRPQERLSEALSYALRGQEHRFIPTDAALKNKRVLFALSCDECGMDVQTLQLLRRLRRERDCLQGSIGSVIVDGKSELYTKQLAQDVVLAANLAGCLFPGKPLIEGTKSLYNHHIMASQRNVSWQEMYFARIRELAGRLSTFSPPKFRRPKLLVLHASESGRSSTLWLWSRMKEFLQMHCDIREISLQNGTIHDCRGCSYHACLHFSKNDTCFYGGAISETVLPAIRESNALVFLCPNYNDAVGANITALFNRLTSLLLHSHLYDKYLFGVVVSGFSGSDLVARQLLGTMCLNKTAMLPPKFCLMQTANDLDAIQKIDSVDKQIEEFVGNVLQTVQASPQP